MRINVRELGDCFGAMPFSVPDPLGFDRTKDACASPSVVYEVLLSRHEVHVGFPSL